MDAVADPTAEAKPETSPISRATRQGLKGLFKAQNILLDLASDQNETAFKAVRKRLKSRAAAAPATALVDSVEDIVKGVVDMQKSIVEIGEERLERAPQTDAEDSSDEGESSTKEKRTLPRLPLGEMLRKNFESAIEAQREVLNLVEKQSKLGVKAWDEFARFTAGKTVKGIVAIARESIENAIDTQGRLVDLGTRQAKESIEMATRQARTGTTKDFARFAEEGVDNLSRAQKRLLEVVTELNSRPDEELAEIEPQAPSRFAERIDRNIERVIKSQHELLDASLRAVNRSKSEQN